MEYKYSTESDVWAFGVVMYEVLTLGCPPFGNLSNEDVYNHVSNETAAVKGTWEEYCWPRAGFIDTVILTYEVINEWKRFLFSVGHFKNIMYAFKAGTTDNNVIPYKILEYPIPYGERIFFGVCSKLVTWRENLFLYFINQASNSPSFLFC